MKRTLIAHNNQSVAERSMQLILDYYLVLRAQGIKKTIPEIARETDFGETTIRNFLLILRDEKNNKEHKEYKEMYRLAFKHTKFFGGELYEEQQNLIKEEKSKFIEAMKKTNTQKQLRKIV